MPIAATATPLVFVLNGPNLNLLGSREPEIYGSLSLDEICGQLKDQAVKAGYALDCRQSNHEGVLIDWLQEAGASGAKAVIFNPGGYTHTSVALRDTVAAISVPVWEVHLSDPEQREAFRHYSYIADVAAGRIIGQGAKGYTMALDEIIRA